MNSSHLSRLYQPQFGLFTDLYQLTMAYGYWKTGLYKRRAVFNLFFRKPPFNGQYALVSGLALAIDLLQHLRFSTSDIQYLGSLKGADGRPLFDEGFLNYLQRMEFSCSLDAIPEGNIVFPHQPLLRVEGPLLQCQLIETALLTLINFSTLISTKAARVVQAAQGDSVLEFGLRRAQGLDGGITASRAAYIGGCAATSNLMAGKLFGIPVKGTHAHSWVMCFDDELTAFQRYAETQPNNCIFLVDTYDTIEGVRNAIRAGQWLREQGHEMNGIRLDSGDLAELSKKARQMLDEAGFPDAAIVASNDLDEDKIRRLKAEGATITVWGVGTHLATAKGQAALGGVYKLSAIEDETGIWSDRIKLSEQEIKVSNPGIQQVWRFTNEMGQPAGDVIYDERDGQPGVAFWDYQREKIAEHTGIAGKPLLVPVFREGRLVYDCPNIKALQSFSLEQQSLFQNLAALPYPYGLSEQLHHRKINMMEQLGADA